MPVKRSRSASRVLRVLEAIARHQPIGVTALARLLDDEKSAVQRAVMTLADEGWIRMTPGAPVRWDVTAHILAVAHVSHGNNDLRQRARPMLERLRDETGETMLLVMPDTDGFVVVDVIESRQVLRTVPHIGMPVLPRISASGRAMLPFVNEQRRNELLGEAPDTALLALYAKVREQGYAVSVGEINPGSTNIAAPILEVGGEPAGAVVLSGPNERLTTSQQAVFGKLIARGAQALSRDSPLPFAGAASSAVGIRKTASKVSRA